MAEQITHAELVYNLQGYSGMGGILKALELIDNYKLNVGSFQNEKTIHIDSEYSADEILRKNYKVIEYTFDTKNVEVFVKIAY